MRAKKHKEGLAVRALLGGRSQNEFRRAAVQSYSAIKSDMW